MSRTLTQKEISELIEELKAGKGLTKEQRIEKILKASLVLLREQESLEAEIRKQKRLRIMRVVIGFLIGLIVVILINRPG